MRFVKARDYDDMSRKTANILSAQIIVKPDCVLGLATGSTPVGAYRCLVHWYEKGDLDFSKVTSVNLDEYRGLTRDNPQSYYYFMQKHLFSHVNINMDRVYVPEGAMEDADEACRRYDAIIRSVGGIDMQLLGIGRNAHIGFNEPNDAFARSTYCVDLTDSTIDANSRFFASREEVPKQAYTMGIQTIMHARKILLAVSGEDKAEAVEKSFFGPVTPWVPASILQFHPDVVVVGDEAAFSRVRERIDQ